MSQHNHEEFKVVVAQSEPLLSCPCGCRAKYTYETYRTHVTELEERKRQNAKKKWYGKVSKALVDSFDDPIFDDQHNDTPVVAGRFLLGNFVDANHPQLSSNLIVVTCCRQIPEALQNLSQTRSHFHFPLEDTTEQTLEPYTTGDAFQTLHQLLLTTPETTRVLFHCNAGISRSPTLLMLYLIRYHHYTLRQAWLALRKHRPCIYPNSGFWRRMSQACKARGDTSVSEQMICDLHRNTCYLGASLGNIDMDSEELKKK